jgi:hypothetical protein
MSSAALLRDASILYASMTAPLVTPLQAGALFISQFCKPSRPLRRDPIAGVGLPRFNARMMPMLANIVGPFGGIRVRSGFRSYCRA